MNTNPCGTRWFKSSYSQAGGECVEIAFLGHGEVGVRDSKNPQCAALVFGGAEWDRFAGAVRSGKFDR
ncbi:MAG: hypothetical protein JWN03_7725 [Nocardia sp.]|uniref:DUF397 domain-containing protein n=1 Tax=Nocardia sp. TaxID=1821 RepID=UPI0026135472|nr:DUF397 domain-containing protein [Nocardia sp.]MCU1647450.1 hypothetical protein [Nocardia sp.]